MSTRHTFIKFKLPLILTIGLGTQLTACQGKQNTHEEIVRADLAIIIESLGSPCKEVLNYEPTGARAYTVHCRSGQQYLISVNPQGRVDVQSHQ